ncbi:Replication protein A (two OB fold, one zinc finger) [Methanosarcina barkeri str. Wiesmoor]|uniref:Replication protein A (Two OB fold, one zinc finger) n=2 Tax=Methanosarcina barkeri TaxID=2208 RepID=A0A0E3QNJ9_METBA|nr:replication protein A [Methanosarcina barkeri]AKB51965.1 Replication protein A (two OB fold, one zinc finger) [Methanosarcina barkeri str. Wiesmoor]
MKQTAESIRDRFLKLGIDVPVEDIESRLDELITKFKVPSNEAQRSVTNYFLKKYSIPKNEFYTRQAEPQLTKIMDISENGQWANLKARVVQLWENTHESISQVGLLGDETGIIKFTAWKNAELPELEQGESYFFRSVVVGEYNDRFQVQLNKNTSIEKLDEAIGVGGGDFIPSARESELRNISDLAGGQWATVKGKVVQLWENSHESIEQAGLIGDPTGVIKFTNWASSELPDMEEGKSYMLKNVVVNEWGGKIQIQLNRSSSIEDLDEDIKVGSLTSTYFGAMVDIQTGSGLIKRCPECKRALVKGACPEHGKVKGEYDLRIKAVLDSGTSTQDILINRELTEKLSGLSLDTAIAMAADALDPGVVLDNLKQELLGRYYTVTGHKLDRYILVDSITPKTSLDIEMLDEMLALNETLTKLEVQ